ncbi:MAG: hypothetical protein GY927_23800 [bacterium]|nr:hypothetical protein [bacterium]
MFRKIAQNSEKLNVYEDLCAFMLRENGAVDQNNLEPAPLVSILDELEEWGWYLEAEPEIIHKLRAFEDAASGTDNKPKETPTHPVRSRGPSL